MQREWERREEKRIFGGRRERDKKLEVGEERICCWKRRLEKTGERWSVGGRRRKKERVVKKTREERRAGERRKKENGKQRKIWEVKRGRARRGVCKET